MSRDDDDRYQARADKRKRDRRDQREGLKAIREGNLPKALWKITGAEATAGHLRANIPSSSAVGIQAAAPLWETEVQMARSALIASMLRCRALAAPARQQWLTHIDSVIALAAYDRAALAWFDHWYAHITAQIDAERSRPVDVWRVSTAAFRTQLELQGVLDALRRLHEVLAHGARG